MSSNATTNFARLYLRNSDLHICGQLSCLIWWGALVKSNLRGSLKFLVRFIQVLAFTGTTRGFRDRPWSHSSITVLCAEVTLIQFLKLALLQIWLFDHFFFQNNRSLILYAVFGHFISFLSSQQMINKWRGRWSLIGKFLSRLSSHRQQGGSLYYWILILCQNICICFALHCTDVKDVVLCCPVNKNTYYTKK